MITLSKRAGETLKPIALMRLTEVDDPDELLKKHKREDIVIQEKLDGWKGQVIKTNGEIKLFSRRGEEITDNFPQIVKVLNLPEGTLVEGEVVYLENNKQDVGKVTSIAGSSAENSEKKMKELKGKFKLFLYDILWVRGKNVSKEPYEKRRKLLSSVVKQNDVVKVVEEYPFAKWQDVMNKAIKSGGEGIVLKIKSAPYEYKPAGQNEPRPGKMFKYKGSKSGGKEATDDFVAFDYDITEKGKLRLHFGQYYKGKLYHISNISNFSKEDEEEIKKKMKKGHFTIELEFQELTPKGLRHERFQRFRNDKSPKDATMSAFHSKHIENFEVAKKAFNISKIIEKYGESKDKEKITFTKEFKEYCKEKGTDPQTQMLIELIDPQFDKWEMSRYENWFKNKAFLSKRHMMEKLARIKRFDMVGKMSDDETIREWKKEPFIKETIMNLNPIKFHIFRIQDGDYLILQLAGLVEQGADELEWIEIDQKRWYQPLLKVSSTETFFISKHAKLEKGDTEKASEVLIEKDGTKLTRGQIASHYEKPAVRKMIMSQIKGKPILVYIGTSKNKNVLKRNHDNKPIVITNDSPKNGDSPDNYFYWVSRRLLSIHEVFGTKTKLGFIDLDLHGTYSLSKAKQYANKLVKVLKSKLNVSPTIYQSGGTGLHIEFKLAKEKDIDALRKELKSLLDEFNKDYPDVSTGIIKGNGMRSDISTLHNKGSLRVAGSLGETYGKEKKPIGAVKNASVKLSWRDEDVIEPLDYPEEDVKFETYENFEGETKPVKMVKRLPSSAENKKVKSPKPINNKVLEILDLTDEQIREIMDEFKNEKRVANLQISKWARRKGVREEYVWLYANGKLYVEKNVENEKELANVGHMELAERAKVSPKHEYPRGFITYYDNDKIQIDTYGLSFWEMSTKVQNSVERYFELTPGKYKVGDVLQLAPGTVLYAADALSKYKSKRKFDETPEPEGKAEKGKNKHRFVIQKHEAERAKTHFDLRLENDEGTMSSWAIPKHKLPSGKEKLLAMKTEDHPVEYNKFHGTIPSGYGAGEVEIYDSGTYEPIGESASKMVFKLKGKKEKGIYNLFKTDGKRWMISEHKGDTND